MVDEEVIAREIDADSIAGDFMALTDADIISNSLCDDMVEMAGFRNALTHDFGEILQREVHRHLHDLIHFESYAESIVKHYENDL